MQFLIIGTFFLSFLLVSFVTIKFLNEKIISQRRIKNISLECAASLEDVTNVKKTKKDYKALLKPISVSIKKGRYVQKWEDKLRRADIPLRGEEFLAIWYVTILASALLLLINIQFILLFFVVLIYPSFYLQSKTAKRIKKFESQLNDALTILANSLRAGFSFFQAMDTVRKEMPDPISKEFGRTLKEINFGTPVEEALKNMSQRVGSNDLDLIVTAVLIQRQVGGNMAEILETISQTISERIKILGEIKTLTAQGRVSGYIIGGLPVVLLVALAIINPEYASILYTSKIGIGILSAGLISEICGVLLIKKIITIEV